MANIEKKTKRHPSDLTDEEWERIGPRAKEACRHSEAGPAIPKVQRLVHSVRAINSCDVSLAFARTAHHYGRQRRITDIDQLLLVHIDYESAA